MGRGGGNAGLRGGARREGREGAGRKGREGARRERGGADEPRKENKVPHLVVLQQKVGQVR